MAEQIDTCEEVTIHGLSVDAEGIGRMADGRVVFVDRALPQDVVWVRPLTQKKRIVVGALEKLIHPSSGRVESRCDIWACGGCPLREASMELAASAKRDRLVSCMTRIGGLDVSNHPILMHSFGDGWRYRHRVRLHAAWHHPKGQETGRWALGYHRRQSQALVPLSTCPVIWPELERMGRAVAGGMTQLPKEAQIISVQLAYSRRDGRGAARIITEGPMATMRKSLEWLDGSELGGLHIEAADGQFRWGNLSLRYDHAEANNFDLCYEPGVFTQAHTGANDALVAHVLEQIGPRPQQRVLELHAGIGNFSLPMARRGARVVAVEINPRSAILLERNALKAGLDIKVHAQSDTWATALLKDRPDVLLMDPARSGAKDVVEAVRALGPGAPRKVVYVSCDPATLARDAKILVEAGMRLTELVGLDSFPQTPHVEAVATFIS